MSRADELLDSLPEDEAAVYSIDPATEPHILINEDRTVIVPDELKHVAVQGEHNVETVTFDCPRYWDEHDLSTMAIRINYQRPDGHREPCPVENLHVDESDTNTIHFDWTISSNVTAVKGSISFMVCAKLSDAEGVREREWHSRLNQDLIIDEGLECSGDTIVEQNPDIIESILIQLDDLKNAGGVSDEQIAIAVAAYLTKNPVEVTDVVKTVNGVYPDESGDVVITIPDSGQNASRLTLTSPDGSKWAVAVKDDGTLYTVEQGGEEPAEPTTYAVANNLTNAVTSNEAASIEGGGEYNAIIAAAEGYSLSRVTITMGGVDITTAAYADGIITIPAVAGDIIITVIAEAATIYNEVQWLDTAYCIGDNSVAAYNGWAPGCARYDPDLDKVVFLQCHRSAHAGVFTDSQLWAIDPYNVMEAELLATFALTNSVVPLAFAIYGGKYYVQSNHKTYISSDKGATWTETTPTASLPTCYGLTIIDDVMYAGNDAFVESSNGIYYTSEDFGANWTERVFDFAENYAGQLTCSEASFAKFGGKIYAALRRESAFGLLAVQDPATGAWSVISEEMPNVSSDVYFYATTDTLCFCAIDRPARNLHLGTINIGESGVTINTVKTYDFSGISRAGDFHTPTYVYGPDFQMVTLMCGGLGVEYKACNNIAIVGYADLTLNNNPTYAISKVTATKANITAEPYVGTSPYTDGAFSSIAAGSVINLNIRCCNTHPLDADGNVYILSPNGGYLYPLGTSNAYGFCLWDGFERNGEIYACFVNGLATSEPWSGIKIMGKAHKRILANVDALGGVVPEDGVFDYAFWSEITQANAATITSYSITAEYVEPVTE